MKNKKIIAIGIMLVLTVTTSLVGANENEFETSIENTRVTLPFEKGKTGGDIAPLPPPFMITTLQYDWNMIGYPNRGSILLDMIYVIHNGTIYTWQDACEQMIVIPHVYGWDRDIQYYEAVDHLEAGFGYWMFSYYDDVELWSLY